MTDHYTQAVGEWGAAMQLLADSVTDDPEPSEASFHATLETAQLNLVSASVQASLALVDAVRELTDAVRDLRHARG